MRIRQAHDLPRITRIREHFLITGETCIENDFAAAARDGACSSSVKYAPVFQREDCRSVNFRQWSLRDTLYFSFASVDDDKEPKWSTGQYAKTARP